MNDTGRGPIRAPRGTSITTRSWLTEAPLRMLMNNLDPEVAERPEELVVYGGIGRAARNWDCYDRIVAALRALGDLRVEVVHQHPQRCLREPAACRKRGAARCADRATSLVVHDFIRIAMKR